MKRLYNMVDRRALLKQIEASKQARTTISFYKYHRIANPALFRDYLFIHWSEMEVLGRTYIASEGINAQISVPDDQMENFRNFLEGIDFLKQVRLNIAVADNGKSFYALKIKLRNKIVADGIDDPRFNSGDTGIHLRAKEFNELTNDPDTILIDMRNHYESEVGHFEGAILPDADTFREEIKLVEDLLKGKEERNIVMYCTGGIRCEKASAWLKYRGFPNVHQLEGGIIKYARDAQKDGIVNKFKGVNFVFDQRLAERISEDVVAKCHQCGNPFDLHTNCNNLACHILFIQCESCRKKYDGCCSEDCMEIYHLPLEEQKKLRKGKSAERNVYRKGRSDKLMFKENRSVIPGTSHE